MHVSNVHGALQYAGLSCKSRPKLMTCRNQSLGYLEIPRYSSRLRPDARLQIATCFPLQLSFHDQVIQPGCYHPRTFACPTFGHQVIEPSSNQISLAGEPDQGELLFGRRHGPTLLLVEASKFFVHRNLHEATRSRWKRPSAAGDG